MLFHALLAIATFAGTVVADSVPTASENAPSGGDLSASLGVTPEELGFDEILFVKRKPYSSDHYYTDINNGTSPDRFVPENGIYIYNLRPQSERPVITASDLPGGKGLIGKISLSFDATKVVFDFREDPAAAFRRRHHPQWLDADPAVPAYRPADFRREATFEEATCALAPAWHQ